MMEIVAENPINDPIWDEGIKPLMRLMETDDREEYIKLATELYPDMTKEEIEKMADHDLGVQLMADAKTKEEYIHWATKIFTWKNKKEIEEMANEKFN